jgi:2-oxoisovalerate dehydrogenase E1 component
MRKVVSEVRSKRAPWLVHARLPLSGRHTNAGTNESEKNDENLAKDAVNDPLIKLRTKLLLTNLPETQLVEIERSAAEEVDKQFEQVENSSEPDAHLIRDFIFAPASVMQEQGERNPTGSSKISMGEAVLISLRDIMEDHHEAIICSHNAGKRPDGFSTAIKTLANQFGYPRVFNMTQAAYVMGSGAGLSTTGVKLIVEIQIADYVFPGFNQLIDVAKSYYLSRGKFPVQTLIRVIVGGTYDSVAVETILINVKGIKIIYASNAADMKGLMKAAFIDSNPVLMIEHKGLLDGALPGTEESITADPDRDYMLPLGVGNVVLNADDSKINSGNSCCIVTYGMGVYRAKNTAKNFPGQIEIIDLRTLLPLDEKLIFSTVKKHGKCLVLTEGQQNNSFAEALAGKISKECFTFLDAPVEVFGTLNLAAVSMDTNLDKAMLPDANKIADIIKNLLQF